MTAIIRIEYVRPRRAGEAYGIATNVIQEVVPTDEGEVVLAEYLTVGAASVRSAVAPVFIADRGYLGGVFTRVTCLAGAAVVRPPSAEEPAPTATDLNGVRVEQGQPPVLFPIEAGQSLAAIEAARSATPLTISGLTGTVPVTFGLDLTAYADGDVLTAPLQIPSVARIEGGSVTLQSVTLLDKADQGQTIDLVFLNAATALGATNGAPNIADAAAEAILAAGSASNALRISAADYIDLGGAKLASKSGLGTILTAAAASKDLWVSAIIRGAATYGAADALRLQLNFFRD